MTAIDIDSYKKWEGKQQIQEDDIALFPARALAAALNNVHLPEKGEALPAFWEWLYFLPTPRGDATGLDGHPDKGSFLPPVPLPRRMWAAGEAEYRQTLIIGQPATRTSTIESVELKTGSTGTLVFVNVRHEISQADTLCISQLQNIVYRDQPSERVDLLPGKSAPAELDVMRLVKPDPVLLFRYSALTYNGHRIHYDRDYAVQEEFYPALVVHGPLLVTLLLELQREHYADRVLKQFKFRAVRPTFDTAAFSISARLDGENLSLWSADESGSLCMTIQANVQSAK